MNLYKSRLTTPGERTNMRGERVVLSSTTCFMSSTGGSTNFDPKLLTMKLVAQKATLSDRSDLTMTIRWSSLHEFSHSPAVKWS